MTSIEEIEWIIESYGYLLVKQKKIRRSYYRIVDDGTIIEALIGIESIVQGECIKICYPITFFSNSPKWIVSVLVLNPKELKLWKNNGICGNRTLIG